MNNQHGYCPLHTSEVLEFSCLDPFCDAENLKCCAFCMKDTHASCENEFIVRLRNFTEQVQLADENNNMEKVFKESFDKQINSFKQQLETKKERLTSLLTQEIAVDDFKDPETLAGIKKNFSIKYDAETRKIKVNSIFNINCKEFENITKNYIEKTTEKTVSCNNYFKNLTLIFKNDFKVEDWSSHGSISVKLHGGGVRFSRNNLNKNYEYYCAIWKKPLETKKKFKLRIKSDGHPLEEVGFGLLTENEYNNIKGTLIHRQKQNHNDIAIFGFNNSIGVTSNRMRKLCEDADSGENKAACVLDYSPEEYIKFYNSNKGLDVERDLFGSTGFYYMFVVLYHPQAVCTIYSV